MTKRRTLSNAFVVAILFHNVTLVAADDNEIGEERLTQPSSSLTPGETLPAALRIDVGDRPQPDTRPAELCKVVGISDYDPFSWGNSDEACDALYHQQFIDTLPTKQCKWSINRERWPVESYAANWQHYTLRGRACVFSCRMLRYSTKCIKDLRENLRLSMMADKSKFEKLVIRDSDVYASSHQNYAVTAKCFREVINKTAGTRKRKRHVPTGTIECIQSEPASLVMAGLNVLTEFGSTSRSPQRRRVAEVEVEDRPFYVFLTMTVKSPNASPGRETAQVVSESPPGMIVKYRRHVPAQATIQVCGIGTSTATAREGDDLDLNLRLWSGARQE